MNIWISYQFDIPLHCRSANDTEKDNSKEDGAAALSIMFSIAKLAVLLLFSKFNECNFRK